MPNCSSVLLSLFSGVLYAWAAVPFSTYVRVGLTQAHPSKSIVNIAIMLQSFCNTYTYIPLTLELYPLGKLCIYVHNICICVNIVVYFNIIIFIVVARL